MSENQGNALGKARERLAAFDELASAFDTLCSRFTARNDMALFISGSLVAGGVTAVSDIDLQIVVKPGSDLAEIRRWVKTTVLELGARLAQFPATHLGLPELEIFFLEQNGEVVKIDIMTTTLDGLPFLHASQVIHDPDGFVHEARAKLRGNRPPGPDYGDLHNKFCGWMWYTFVKISKGYVLEAVESLDTMRSYALLPFLHLVESNPPHGYRHVETRLSAERLAALQATFPIGHANAELYRAFWAMVELFESLQEPAREKLGVPLSKGDLPRMKQLIERYAAKLGGSGLLERASSA